MHRCRSCDAPIRWLVMKTGKRNPMNPDPDPDRGNVLEVATDHEARVHGTIVGRGVALNNDDAKVARALGRELLLSHFVTCPNRAEHAKRKKDRKTT